MLLTQPANYLDQHLFSLQSKLDSARNKQNSSLITLCLYDLARVHVQKGNFKDANILIDELLEITFVNGDKFLQMKSYTLRGVIEMYDHSLEAAIDDFFKVFSFDHEKSSYEPFNYLNWIYLQQDKLDKAGAYLSKAELAIDEFYTPQHKILFEISNGLFNSHIGKYKSSLQYFNKAYIISRESGLPYEEVMTLLETAKIWFDNDVFSESKRLTSDAMEIAELYGFKYLNLQCALLKAECDINLDHLDEALVTLDVIEHSSKKNAYNYPLLNGYKLKQLIYKKTKEKKKEKEMKDAIGKLNNTIQEADAQKILDILNSKEKELKFLLQKNRAAVQQLEDLQNLQKIIAHDLKEPLRNIGGYTGMLGKSLKEELKKEDKEYIGIINSATQRMDDSLTSLLRYLSFNQEGLRFKKWTIEAVLINAFQSLSEDTSFNPSIVDYSSCKNVELDCDMNSLSRVFVEIIENAMKFNHSPSNTRVNITVKDTREFHEISVRDNGIGIDTAYHDKIFNLFTRLDRAYEGFGTGLAMARKIIRQHGGKIRVESEEGNGCDVIFTINKIR